jgi:hypothetical protein
MLDFNGTQLWIGIDNDTAPNNCFLIDCYKREAKGWKGGQAMIRVEGEEIIDFIEIVPNSIFVDEDALKIFFKIIAPSDSIEARATLQAGSLIEDCKIVFDKGFYETRIKWPRLSGLKEPAKLSLSVKALNSTATLIIELNETLFSKYLELKEENERLRAMVNNSIVELRASRDKLEKEENVLALLRTSLKEYQEMVSEKVKENERLAKELYVMRFLVFLLTVLTASLLTILLRWRTLVKPGGDKNA